MATPLHNGNPIVSVTYSPMFGEYVIEYQDGRKEYSDYPEPPIPKFRKEDLCLKELQRKYLNDGTVIAKGQRLYKEYEYEDPWKNKVIRTEKYFLTVTDVYSDGSIYLALFRKAGIQYQTGTTDSQYRYHWNPHINQISSPNPSNMWGALIGHVLSFFNPKQRPVYDKPQS